MFRRNDPPKVERVWQQTGGEVFDITRWRRDNRRRDGKTLRPGRQQYPRNEVVPTKSKIKYNDRSVSEKTKSPADVGVCLRKENDKDRQGCVEQDTRECNNEGLRWVGSPLGWDDGASWWVRGCVYGTRYMKAYGHWLASPKTISLHSPQRNRIETSSNRQKNSVTFDNNSLREKFLWQSWKRHDESEYESLGSEQATDTITYAWEFEEAVKRMKLKLHKTVGSDVESNLI